MISTAKNIRQKVERIGERWKQKSGQILEIIEYNNAIDVKVKFDDGTIIEKAIYSRIIRGFIGNMNAKLCGNVYKINGVGYAGVGKHLITINRKMTKKYQTWLNMVNRCPGKTEGYKNCLLDERWHNYQNFGNWYDENYIDGWELDKDILFKGNKVYGPDTCCFLPMELNRYYILRPETRGQYLIGVYFHQNKFNTRLKINGKMKFFTGINTEIEAFEKYKYEKETEAVSLAWQHIDKLPTKVYNAIINYKVEITD